MPALPVVNVHIAMHLTRGMDSCPLQLKCNNRCCRQLAWQKVPPQGLWYPDRQTEMRMWLGINQNSFSDVKVGLNAARWSVKTDMVLKTGDIHPPKTGISVHFSCTVFHGFIIGGGNWYLRLVIESILIIDALQNHRLL